MIDLRPTSPATFTENDWDGLLAVIMEGQVIPIVGPELSIITDPDSGQPLLFETWLARHVGHRLNLPAETVASLTNLDDLVCLHLRHGGAKNLTFYTAVKNAVQAAPFPPPAPLIDLAGITDFKLILTTTFDTLLAKAFALARPGMPLQELAFAPARQDDLPGPLESLNHPVLYQLFGKVSPTAGYVVCDEDILEWITALQGAPEKLDLELKSHHLLFIGLNYGDWVTRFLVRAAKRLRLSQAREFQEYLADPMEVRSPRLLDFLRTHSKSSIVVAGTGDAVTFAATLRQKWNALRAPESSGAPPVIRPPDPVMPAGAVFISYSRTDLAATQSLKAGLDQADVVSWFDFDQLEGGDAYAEKIRKNIFECRFFLPVISSPMLNRDEAFFWSEWRWAIQRASRMAIGAVFVLPVIIDDTPPDHPRIPEDFKERDIFRLPGGKPTPEFIARLVKLTRGASQ